MSKEPLIILGVSVEFQDRLTALVVDSGYKKSELAKIIGISQAILIRGTNVGMIPSTSSLIKIADYFDVSIDYLVGLKDNDNFIRSDISTTFQERLYELKQSGQKTEYEIALKLGFQRSLFTKWSEKGYTPSFEIISMLAQYFEVSIDYLLGRTDEK